MRLGKLFRALRNKLRKPQKQQLNCPSEDWITVEFQHDVDYDMDSSNCSSIAVSYKPKRLHPASYQGRLALLAPEILLIIASNLSTSSAVSFSLSCKSIYGIFGLQYITELNAGAPTLDCLIYVARLLPRPIITREPRERERLLMLLEKDLDHLIYCYFCQKLHGALDTPVRVNEPSPKYPCTYAKSGTRSCNIIFNLSQVRMAMKLYQKGIDPGPHLRILSQSTKASRCFTSATQAIPRIVSDNLLMKVVHTYTVPFDLVQRKWSDGSLMPPTKSPNWSAISHLSRCPDSGINIQAGTVVYEANEMCRPTSKPVMNRCPRCMVEYEIRAIKITSQYAVVQCDSWHHLGKGDEPYWSPVLMSHWIQFMYFERPLGNIRSMFEGLLNS